MVDSHCIVVLAQHPGDLWSSSLRKNKVNEVRHCGKEHSKKLTMEDFRAGPDSGLYRASGHSSKLNPSIPVYRAKEEIELNSVTSTGE